MESTGGGGRVRLGERQKLRTSSSPVALRPTTRRPTGQPTARRLRLLCCHRCHLHLTSGCTSSSPLHLQCPLHREYHQQSCSMPSQSPPCSASRRPRAACLVAAGQKGEEKANQGAPATCGLDGAPREGS